MLVGLPDTIWFPENGFASLTPRAFSFLLFPVDQPQLFDAVVTDENGWVQEVQVKQSNASTKWVWGAFRLPVEELADLHELWNQRGRKDQYFGTLVNAYLALGKRARGVRHGETYVDVGTLHGYHEAVNLLASDDKQTREINVAA